MFVLYVTVVSGGRLTHRCASATAWPASGTPNPTLWLTRNPAPFVLTSGSAGSPAVGGKNADVIIAARRRDQQTRAGVAVGCDAPALPHGRDADHARIV